MKKKFLSVILATAMILPAMVMSVSAAETVSTIDQDSRPQSAAADISVDIAPAYTVTIPEDTEIPFNKTETDFGKVELTAARLEVGKSITVSAQAGALVNLDDSTKTIPYTVMAGESEFTSGEYTAQGQSTELTLVVDQNDWDSACAGSYEGTVTFTVSYGNVTTP